MVGGRIGHPVAGRMGVAATVIETEIGVVACLAVVGLTLALALAMTLTLAALLVLIFLMLHVDVEVDKIAV